MKKNHIIFILFLMSVICSCSESEHIDDQLATTEITTRVPASLMSNIRLFLFDGDNRNGANGQYYQRILNVTRAGDQLSMDVETGLWNIGLVSCENNPLNELIDPVRGTTPGNLPMWRTAPVGGVLPNTPEICTGLLSGVNVVSGTSQTEAVDLHRHVGMVRVALTDGVGFATGSGHQVYLYGVPTTLSWGGSLYPNKTNPETDGSTRMQGTLTFVDAGNGRQKSSNVAEFIVPAHLSANANDTTTHHLVLGVKFNTMGGTPFEKEVMIDKVPRDNRILQVNLTAKGGVEVQTMIAPWNLETLTVSPDLYDMLVDYNTVSNEWECALFMKQERNWWITLEGAHPGSFEFVDSSAASGQIGTTILKVKRSSQHPGTTQSATLNLHVSGYSGVVQSYTIQG